MKISKMLNVIFGIAIIILLSIIIREKSDGASSKNKNTIPVNTDNPAFENILTRKSVRSYTQQAISEKQIDQLLKAAMAAPSAMNRQPWAFVVINKRDILDSCASRLPYAKMAANASLAILVCGDLNKAIEGAGKDYWIQDCSAATENLLLAAESLGLGAVWTGLYPIEDRVSFIKEILSLPEHIIPLAFVPIGYPLHDEKPKNKYNKENVYINAWKTHQ